jgi:chemotaxis protein histidine kinase CheA
VSALREAVIALGGTIEIESRRGHGTTLRCRFPEVARQSQVLRLSSQPIRTAV